MEATVGWSQAPRHQSSQPEADQDRQGQGKAGQGLGANRPRNQSHQGKCQARGQHADRETENDRTCFEDA
jgi:hypothetical protein